MSTDWCEWEKVIEYVRIAHIAFTVTIYALTRCCVVCYTPLFIVSQLIAHCWHWFHYFWHANRSVSHASQWMAHLNRMRNLLGKIMLTSHSFANYRHHSVHSVVWTTEMSLIPVSINIPHKQSADVATLRFCCAGHKWKKEKMVAH